MDVNDIHNYTAYIAWALIGLHVIFLLVDKTSKFIFIDAIFPINAPTQSLVVAFSTLSLYALTVMIITTQKAIKRKMSFRAWKNIHLISYGAPILFVVYGVLIDQHLQNMQPDYFDGEKELSEVCGIALIVVSAWRFKYYLKKARA